MKDIAEAAGVSKGLVSLILSGAAGPSPVSAARVLAIADRMGYRADRAASLLARRRSRLFGVTMQPESSFHGELVSEVQRVADANGYDIALAAVTPDHGEQRAVESLLDLRCEGLMLLGSALSPQRLGDLAQAVPVVSLGRREDLPGMDVVRSDDGAGVAALVDHLVGLGHRRIAHVDGGQHAVALDRSAAYRRSMTRHHLLPVVIAGGQTQRTGYDAGRQLVTVNPEVTAVVAFNDRVALGVLELLDGRGFAIPGDVSVTGFDDSILSQLPRIDLTTVGQHLRQQAALAVTCLVQRLDAGRVLRAEHVLDPQLIVRSSSGPPGAVDKWFAAGGPGRPPEESSATRPAPQLRRL